MGLVRKITIYSCSILLFLGCEEDNRIIIDTSKGKSKSGFRTQQINQPAVEVLNTPKQKKKVTYNNRLDIIINKFKLENLKNEELDEYIKSLFTLYRETVLDKFLTIPVGDFGDDYIVFQTDRSFKHNFEIRIESEDFDPDGHKLEKHKDWYLYKIDGVPFLGTDGTTPNKKIKSMQFKINGTAVDFPEDAYKDLYEPNFCKFFSSNEDAQPEICYINALISKDYKYIFILMEGGEAAGIYEVIWVFRLGQFYTRSINIPY